MPDPTLQDVLEEVRALRAEIRTRDLVPVAELADALGVTERTIKRQCSRHGIPLRDMHGAPKQSGSRARPYVSRSEWARKEKMHTQAVRRRDG